MNKRKITGRLFYDGTPIGELVKRDTRDAVIERLEHVKRQLTSDWACVPGVFEDPDAWRIRVYEGF